MVADISICRPMRSETASSTIVEVRMARLERWNVPLPAAPVPGLSSRSADRKARRTPSRVPAASYSARCLRLAAAETRQSFSRRQQKLEEPPARFVFSQETFPVQRPEPLLSKARSDISAAWINSTAAPVGRASQHREADDEGDRGDGSGRGNGRDEAGGAARAAGGGARRPFGRELRRRRCSGSCVGIHRG